MTTIILAAAIAQTQTTSVPVTTESEAVPRAVQQRYLSQAVDEAVAELDLGDLHGRTVRITIAGVMPMSDENLGDYIAASVRSRVVLAGGRVAEEGEPADTELIVKVGQAGLDQVTETSTDIQQDSVRRVGPRLLMAAGGGLVAISLISLPSAVRRVSEWGSVDNLVGYSVAAVVGGAAFAAGWRHRGEERVVETTTTETTTSWHMRVSVDATVAPPRVAAWTTHGDADLVVAE